MRVRYKGENSESSVLLNDFLRVSQGLSATILG